MFDLKTELDAVKKQLIYERERAENWSRLSAAAEQKSETSWTPEASERIYSQLYEKDGKIDDLQHQIVYLKSSLTSAKTQNENIKETYEQQLRTIQQHQTHDHRDTSRPMVRSLSILMF